jgi:tRNA threonylcarbamoyladenosine biosynthesis protein TsaB
MKNILIIDTTNNKEMLVGLKIDGKDFLQKKALDTRKAQVVLPLLEQLLKEHNLSLKELTEIEVSPGPGSFTGIRVGLSIANTLGFLLNIPVNGNKVGEQVSADY